ncbi:putative E3 ubiquitin-protein ligase HERC3 [Oryzias melastigma]|uniref:Putative E3 ubiquitin-protein ligase HERC3 n=1 Tax=Oryzias melastigma TaxID=30732 RepID=A0A834F5A8_ORYME|nr:putative E3 ubiquitin-protein ligase HERC3 [Oryzias melastigma]
MHWLECTRRGESGTVLTLRPFSVPEFDCHSLCFSISLPISNHFAAMLCWGNARDGQLGIGVERNPVFEPRMCHVFSGRGLREVACGGQHTLFLLQDGSVYTCGSNSCGQLGHDKAGILQLVGALDTQKITMVSCGRAHSVAVNEQGQVFVWGAGDGGQLGLGAAETAVRIPRLVKKLCDHSISQVVCGNQHCIALSRDGQLFTWGQNSSGQLGLGKGETGKLSPSPVKSLAGIPLAQITAGGDHCFAVSMSGAVFGWGKNKAGQLGLNDKQDRAVPCHIKFLRSQKVVYISCGDEHTAALTKNGGLFTFGDGSRGQLDLRKYSVIKIISGGDHSFLMYSSEQCPAAPEDFRVFHVGKSLSPINHDRLNSWRLKLLYNTDANVSKDIVIQLSSAACWNASFLDQSDDAHFKTNPKISGIDLNSVRMLFETLSKPAFAGVQEQATTSFESLLIPQLPRSPPDVEAMRIYLILSEYPALQDSKNYIRLTIPLAIAILRLDANPSKVLDNWWCVVDVGVFTRMVDMYKSIVVYMLTGGKSVPAPMFYENYFMATLRLLEKLHKVNLKAQHVEYNHFYIPDITTLVDIQEDYLKWFLSKAQIKVGSSPSQSNLPPVNLCAFPFILNAQAKTTMLQTDAELQMQMAVSGANLHNVFMLLTLEPHLARNPYLVLHVRRNHLVSDTLRELTVYSDVDLKKPLKVIFDGEEAVDAGGLTKEFFLLLLKELMDPVYGMFTHYKDSNLLWFSDKVS